MAFNLFDIFKKKDTEPSVNQADYEQEHFYDAAKAYSAQNNQQKTTPTFKTENRDAIVSWAAKTATGKDAGERPAYQPQPINTTPLSQRSMDNDRRNGIDWTGASPEQQQYNDIYYKTLDDPTHTRMYQEMESAAVQHFDASDAYKAGRDSLDQELAATAKQYGKGSMQYRALEQFIKSYEDLGRQMTANATYSSAKRVSQQMDTMIQDVFAGVINSSGYRSTVEEGRKKIEQNPQLYHRYKLALDAASDTQRDLMYYVYATEGDKGARDFFDRFLGDTLNYEKGSRDFVTDITTNDTKGGRAWEANKANWAAAIEGQFGTGVRQTFTDMSADPNDRTLVKGYTINDSIDDYLRGQFRGLNDEDLATFGGQGLSALGYLDASWVKDMQKEASDYQKNVLGYLYLATGDESIVEQVWGELKQRGDAIWQTVNGSQTVATAAAAMEGQQYRDYLGLAGTKAPAWMGNPGQASALTAAQAIWDFALTTRAQYPQMAANIMGSMAFGPVGGQVLGNAVMSTSVYGNAYKQALEEGKDPNAAIGYAATQAASEFAVGMLLDGIAPIAGSLTGKAGTRFVQNISNPFLRAVTNAGIRAFGEGTEEYIQEIAEPLIRNLWFHESNSFEPFSEEAVYSFFLGAMSALSMSPVSNPVGIQINQNYAEIGKALNFQGSTEKLVDTVLNNPVEGDKEQVKLYNEARELAEMIKSGKVNASDLNVGELLAKFAQAGGDVQWLTDPSTLAYIKDSLSYDDMVAGATSMLSELEGPVELAQDIAKLALGQAVTEEAQTRINESAQAQEVLSQLQGDLDMSVNNALTRAARATVFKGTLNKVYSTLKNENPNKTVVTPAVQLLYNSGLRINEAEAVGAVFNKVLDGTEITEKEAKLVKVNSPAIRAAALQLLGLEISEYANNDAVLEQLNELAQTNAKIKEQQAAVKESAASAARARGAAMQGGFTNGLQETDNGEPVGVRQNANGPGLQNEVPGGVAETNTGAERTEGSSAPGVGRGLRSGTNQGTAQENVRQVIPDDQLDEGQKQLQQRLISNGFELVEFVIGENSACGYDSERGVYTVQIRVDGQFGQTQYSDHETLHLWLDALTAEQKNLLLLKAGPAIFGESFGKAFDFVKILYDRLGYNDGLDAQKVFLRTIEDMLCFANGGQNFRGMFDFSAYQDAVRAFIEENDLEAIGTGDLSNPAVRDAMEKGYINQTYYDRHGYGQSDSTELDIGGETGEQHSADYDQEFYRSIGLISPDGQTAAFTDNIGGVHEEVLNQLNGTEGEDIKDFIARGGIRVKPNSGIEVNGDIAPTTEQYDVIERIVESFTGKVFSIDFNINGVSAGTHTFDGADLDPNRVYTYLRNYYARRKADIARDEKLKNYSAILGMPVKTMEDAYKAAKFLIQMDGENPELQEIIDTYENQRYSADYLNPESEDYLGPEIDEATIRRGQEDDVYRNQDIWFENRETEVDEDALGPETSMDEDLLDARMDMLYAELEDLDADSPRVQEIFTEIQRLQEQNFNKTKAVDSEEEAPKKKTKKAAKPKAEKTPVETAFQAKAEPAQISEEQPTLQQLQAELDSNPELANDPAFLERATALAQQMQSDMEEKAQALAATEAALKQKEQAATNAFRPAQQSTPAETAPEGEQTISLSDDTKYSKKDKGGQWWRKIGKAETIEIRRRRSDRNTYDVRFTDRDGSVITYEDVSPAMLTKAFGVATGDREAAKYRAQRAMDLASTPSLIWGQVENRKLDKKAPPAKPNRSKDNLGRDVPAKLSQYLEKSAVRTDDGALINTYRLAAANGVHNAKIPGKISLFSERPATMNAMRGLTGAAAYGQSEKSAGAQLTALFNKLADPKITAKEIGKVRQQIRKLEQDNAKYVSGITRLDPYRPGFQFAQRENIINGKSVLESYLDIRKPLVIDAEGKGLDFIQRQISKFVANPANQAGLFDENKDPVGPYDGFKFLNARIIPEGETLGGGELDLDTVYATLRNNQAKSTYNTAPTDSDLMQYSADYDAKIFQDMLDKGILERRETGSRDIDGNYISLMQKVFFAKAKSLNREGKLVNGVIPLFHGGRSIYFDFDKDKAHALSFYLSTNPAVSEGYTMDFLGRGKGRDVVDLMKREALVVEFAEKHGITDPVRAINKLVDDIKFGSPEDQANAAKTFAQLFNIAHGDSFGEITPIASRSAAEAEQHRVTLDDLAYRFEDALVALEDIMDATTDATTRKALDEIHEPADDLLVSLLNYQISIRTHQLSTQEYHDIVVAARAVLASEWVTDPETGEIYNSVIHDLAESIYSEVEAINDLSNESDDIQFRIEGRDPADTVTVYELPDVIPTSGVTAFYANTTNPLVIDGTNKKTGQPGQWEEIDVSNVPGLNYLYDTASTDEIARWAYRQGYDSVIIRNIYDLAEWNPPDGSGAGDDYIIFDSSNVKSVNNRTPTNDPRFNHSADYADVDTGYTEGTLEDTILKILWDKDEDHALAALTEYMYQFMQTGVLPEIEEEKTKNIFQPKVSSSAQKVLEAQLKANIKKYGALEGGENPARDIVFPRETDEGYARRVFRTAAESEHTPDRAIPSIEREFVQGEGGVYQRITDKAAIAFADREMRKKGYDKVKADWEGKLDMDQRPTKNDVALGELLYIEAVKVGDMETAMKTLVELAEIGTTAGQVVQAFRMLKNMPKTYQLYYFQRVANRLNRQFSKQINSNRMSEITINRDLARAVLQAKSQAELDEAVENLIQDMANQIPATFQDKWNAWRYLSMLGNPKTHIRNILGNAIFTPAKFAKDLIAASLETTFIRNPNQRRTSLRGLLDRQGTREYRAFAEQDFEGIKNELQSGGKYNPTNRVLEARKIFNNKALEQLRKLNGDLLEKEDGLFLKHHYVNSMTNFLATRGMDIETLQNSKDGARLLNAARQYAFSEAQKATYRDASAVATALNNVKRTKGIGLLLEGLLPFTKTPINILKRGVEYSPIGLLDAVSRQALKLKNGEIDANTFIDSLSAGLTGTGIAILGLWLASAGLLKGGDDDNEKKADFDKLLGYQNYSINIGNTNYTIDWMAPSALPLFVGAAIHDEMMSKNGLSFADYYNALTVIAEPITQLSMLSGLNDALKSAKWDSNPTASILQTMISGYFTQAIPTVVAQISRSLSEDRRTTYVDKNSDIPQPIQRWFQTNVLGKTPFNSERPEYIDAWGRKDTTKSFALRLFDNMLSPGYRNEINITSVDAELLRLAEATGNSVLMSPADKSIEFNNETHNLTAEQYQTYAVERGSQTFEMLGELFNSAAYSGLSEEEKAKAVTYLKEYGNVLGKQAVFSEYDPSTDNWAEKCDGSTTRLMNMAMLKAQASERGITVSNNGQFYQMVYSTSWLSPVEQGYAMAQQYTTTSKTVYTKKNGPTYDLTAERKDMMYEHFREIFPGYYTELVGTQKWQTADDEKKLKLLEDLRAEVGGVAKQWLAYELYNSGAAQTQG